MPADLYVRLREFNSFIHLPKVSLESTAGPPIVVWPVSDPSSSSGFPRFLRFSLDSISAWPSFFSILLATVLKVTKFICKSLPRRWNDENEIYFSTPRCQGSLENVQQSVWTFSFKRPGNEASTPLGGSEKKGGL